MLYDKYSKSSSSIKHLINLFSPYFIFLLDISLTGIVDLLFGILMQTLIDKYYPKLFYKVSFIIY